MTYKHRYQNDNGQVKFTIELHTDNKIYTKPDNYQGDLYLKALKEKQVESYTTDTFLNDNFELIPEWEQVQIAAYNEGIKQQRQARYQSEVDPLTLELQSRELIGDLTDEEKAEIIKKIADLRAEIKESLIYKN